MKPSPRKAAATGAALILIAWATATQAADRTAQAGLPDPMAAPHDRILDGRIWRCEGATCRSAGESAPASQPVLRECRRLVRVLGPLISYRSGPVLFDAAALARCNGPWDGRYYRDLAPTDDR